MILESGTANVVVKICSFLTSNTLKIISFKIIQADSFVKCGDWFTGISHFELCNRVSSSIRVVEQ